jgi:hypothetical protein
MPSTCRAIDARAAVNRLYGIYGKFYQQVEFFCSDLVAFTEFASRLFLMKLLFLVSSYLKCIFMCHKWAVMCG